MPVDPRNMDGTGLSVEHVGSDFWETLNESFQHVEDAGSGVLPGVEITDPGDAGAIPVVGSGYCNLVSGAAPESRTVADPASADIRIRFSFKTDGGGDVGIVFVSQFDGTGNKKITMADAGDWAEVASRAVGAGYTWVLVAESGCALTP